MPLFRVKGDPFEEFGFRVSPDYDLARTKGRTRTYSPVVDLVLPNTAAAKGGLRPGDRILVADGAPTLSTSKSIPEWQAMQHAKWREIAAGATGLTWTLDVETAGTWQPRRVVLRLPTPAPNWGVSEWRQPTDREPVRILEPGPLAQRAEEILNHGIWMILRGIYVKGFQLPTDAEHPNLLCYQWTLWSDGRGHRMYVSRQRGRTDIVLEVIYRANTGLFGGSVPTVTPDRSLGSATTVLAIDSRAFLTSPSGRLEAAWRLPWHGRQGEIPLPAAEADFKAEVDFWSNRVGKTSPLWPLGLKP